MAEYDVIVIGAGLSGLSCAKWLGKNGIKNVIVLEARDRVGGRTWTKKDPHVKYVDMGGSYVGPTQNYLLRMAKELGVESYKVDETKDLVYYRNGKSTRFSDGAAMPFSFLEALDANNLFRMMDKMGEEIPAEAPWNAPHAEKWDRTTFKEFIDNTCYTSGAYDYATIFLTLLVNAEAWESSLLWFLWYVKICGGVKRIISTTNGGQERKFVGGSMQLSEKMVEIIGKDKVKLNHPVHQIIQADGKVVAKALNGSTFTAKYIILAIPPGIQNKIHYSPELPPMRNQLCQRMPVGTVMKCVLYYKTAFWKENGFCGSMFILDMSDDFPIPYVLDDTKPDGSFPALVGFIVTDRLRRLAEQLTPEERMRRLANNYAKALGCEKALHPIHYEEKNWAEEQYSGGGYASIQPPGFMTTYGKLLRQPLGSMYFAGSETAIAWSCYMDGAISAGERAAREVLHAMGKIRKEEIWVKEPMSKDVPEIPFEDTYFEKYAPSARCVVRLAKVGGSLSALIFACCVFQRYETKIMSCLPEWIVGTK
jgi:monoamine oxidase